MDYSKAKNWEKVEAMKTTETVDFKNSIIRVLDKDDNIIFEGPKHKWNQIMLMALPYMDMEPFGKGELYNKKNK